MIESFAQSGEDVRLWRVLGHKERGFYVDVGAGDPVVDSVTKLFYDAGWNGINIEPGPKIERLREARPRDTNLELAIAKRHGQVSMSISEPDPGYSTLRPWSLDLPDGFTWSTKTVEASRLEDVLAAHARGREIDFLKIDVEGLEREVLESFDLLAVRPRVLLLEAISPIDNCPTHMYWEPILVDARYISAAFDGINRYYVPAEHEDLVPALEYPISALDRYARQGRSTAEVSSPELGGRTQDDGPHVERLEAALRDTSASIRAMEATLSWRITKPLRTIRRAQLRRSTQDYVATPPDDDRLRAAFAGRLRQCSSLLDGREQASSARPLPPLDDALIRFGTASETALAPRAAIAWLALLSVTGSYPLDEHVVEVERTLRCDGSDGLVRLIQSKFDAALGTGTVSTRELDVVSGCVVVDVSQLASSNIHTGIQRVARETVSRWIGTRPSLRLACFDPDDDALTLLSTAERDRITRWREELGPSGSRLAARIPDASRRALVPWGCHMIVPEVPQRERTEALRGLVTSRILGSLALIGYDLIPIVAAEMCAGGTPELFAHYLSLVRVADRVSTITRQSAEDFRAFGSMLGGLGGGGPDVREHVLPTIAPELTAGEVDAAHRLLEAGGLPVVLVVGSHEPRKNHAAVLEAAERLWARDYTFATAFVGGGHWRDERFSTYARLLQSRGRPVTVLRRVSERELWAAYRVARFTMFPSLIEGYGLPIVESLTCGTPVITSNYGSMAEVAAGGGALLVDPRNLDELEEQMLRLLTDDELLERLRVEARARDFGSWDEYAKDVWSFFVGDRAGAER
jgi:FkbM family methyltransferase